MKAENKTALHFAKQNLNCSILNLDYKPIIAIPHSDAMVTHPLTNVTQECDYCVSRNFSVLVIVDNSSRKSNYALALKTLKCYCAAKNYTIDVIRLSHNGSYSMNCPQKNFYLQRHCVTVEYMKSKPHLKWILFLGDDIGVINPRHEIEEFINETAEAEIELIFFERLITWEIVAGSYLAKNTQFVHNFLTEWANYTSYNAYHRDDQGPLHQVFLKRFQSFRICEEFYNASSDYHSYLVYVACARHFLGIDTRAFDSHIKLIRSGDAWVRDGSKKVTSFWSNRDFMFYGWKESEKNWIRPFIKNDVFRLDNCRLFRNRTQEAIFEENWQYIETLNETDIEIETIIDLERNESIRGYETASEMQLQRCFGNKNPVF